MASLQTVCTARRQLQMSVASVAAFQPARILPQLFFRQPHQTPFSTTAALSKRSGRGKHNKPDERITLIRYHLHHPKNPRPLRFSRLRHLRHWTIHRAWQIFRANQRQTEQLELERQYNSMRNACEALRLIGEDGLAIKEPGRAVPPPGARDVKTVAVRDVDGKDMTMDVGAVALKQGDVGRLYRIAMEKKGVWNGVPIEYARTQTDTPPRAGWDHAWTR